MKNKVNDRNGLSREGIIISNRRLFSLHKKIDMRYEI